MAGFLEPPREVATACAPWGSHLGQMAERDGSASRGFDPHPEGSGPRILEPMLPVLRPSPDAQAPEPRGEARGGTPQGAWSVEAGPRTPGSAEAGCVLTQHARPGVGQAAGRAAEARGLVPRATMAKTVAYFYDPDVGNFHYGEGTRCYARGSGTRRFRG